MWPRLKQRAYYVTKADDARLSELDLNKDQSAGGCYIKWNVYGGVRQAWELALKAAGW